MRLVVVLNILSSLNKDIIIIIIIIIIIKVDNTCFLMLFLFVYSFRTAHSEKFSD